MSDLFQRVEKCIEGYACGCPFANAYGCTDCLNTGYLFDNEEIYLLMEVSKLTYEQKDLIQKLQKENEELKAELGKSIE